MVPVLLAVQTLIVLALIVVVLLQRSEGGAVLGGGSFMTGRGAANALTRSTSVLGGLFMATSLVLGVIAARGEKERTVIEEMTGAIGTPGKTPTSTDDLLKSLGAEPDAAPATLDEPAKPAPAPTTDPAAPAVGATPPAASQAAPQTTPAPAADPAAQPATNPAIGPAPPPAETATPPAEEPAPQR